jgi:hypothetical protein
MTEEPFARELRSFLQRRAAEPSPALRARVSEVTVAKRSSRWLGPLTTVAAWAAVVAVAVVGLSMATRFSSSDVAVPGAGPGQDVFPAAGVGFHEPGPPWGHLLVAGLAIAVLLLGIAFARRPALRLALVAVLGVGALGVAGVAMADPVRWPEQTWLTGEGYVDTVATSDWNEHWFAVDEGEPFTVGFEVENAGPLPMTIVGIVEPYSPVGNYTVVGLGLPRTRPGDVAIRSAAIRDTVPFELVVLAPGDRQVVVVAFVGGPCAAAQLPGPDERAGIGLPDLAVVHSILGWERVETVRIRDARFIGVEMDCPGPRGPVDPK